MDYSKDRSLITFEVTATIKNTFRRDTKLLDAFWGFIGPHTKQDQDPLDRLIHAYYRLQLIQGSSPPMAHPSRYI